MKRLVFFSFLSLAVAGSVHAQGLYYIGSEAQNSMPLKWSVGLSAVYDDNVMPGAVNASGREVKESSFGLNPDVGFSFVNITPQTTWDVYARLGLVYYLDAPEGMDDVNSQSRLGVNLTHNFSERLRFSSKNFVAYELEPDYSYGYAGSRQTGSYLYWQTDDSVGFRWTERFGTYTGVRLEGSSYPDVTDSDIFTWNVYNQFRYQLNPQTVLTAEYRYGETSASGFASDSVSQYATVGLEQRFSANTVATVSAGAQFYHPKDGGDNSVSPYLEGALSSQLNQQFSVRSYVRYGIEAYNTVQSADTNRDNIPDSVIVYDDAQTLRFGLSAEYAVSPMFSIFGGVDYIPTSFGSGRYVSGFATGGAGDAHTDLISASIGFSMKFTQYLIGSVSYSYTNSSSDIAGQDYDRNRVSVGLNAEF